MSAHQQNPTNSTLQEIRARKMRLAEGGVIFVLVLGVCIYLGIHFARQGCEESASIAAVQASEFPAALASAAQPVVTAAMTQPPVSQAAAGQPGAQAGESTPLAAPVKVTYTSAEGAYHEGRFEQAAEMFADYCDQNPANAWGHYLRGLSLWKAGRAADARLALATALGLQPDHLKSLVNSARIELELGAPEAALAHIEHALDIAPQHVEALRVLGRIEHGRGLLEAAAATYRQALRLQADDRWSLNNLGLIYIEQGRCDLALPPLARACELAPKTAVIRNNLGMALERTGHFSQALSQYENAALLGSPRGELNLARLEAVHLPSDEPVADLIALAAAWSGPEEIEPTVATAVRRGEAAGEHP